MAKWNDRFGNDRNAVRVPYNACIYGFDEDDLSNLKQAFGVLYGFAEDEAKEFLEVLGITEQDVVDIENRLNVLNQLHKIGKKDIGTLFVLANLMCAAYGDEELATITGRGRDEHFLTIRRLYFAFMKSRKSQTGL